MDSIWKNQDIEQKETFDLSSIDKVLRIIRKENNLTIMELSKKSGVSHRTINDYELGKHVPTLFMCEALLNTMGYRLEIVKDDDRSK